MGEFVRVGSADEVPDGGIATFSSGPRQIAVANVAGTLFAFDEVCTHAACSLADGDLEGSTVVCACHLGTFDLTTGEVLDGPPPSPIGVYPVKVVDGDLMIEL